MSSRGGAGPSQRRGSGGNREKARDEPNIPEYPLHSQQRKHRTNAFSQDGDVDLNAMRFRQHEMTVPWDERYKDYFSDACLLQTQRIGFIQWDARLITALRERWRKETHTFHMPHGEMTITLDDVSCLLGLWCDGEALCRNTGGINWTAMITELLGKTPGPNDFKKGSKILLKRSWLREIVSDLERDASQDRIDSGDCVSVKYLVFLEDLSQLHIWAWGSGVLAYLYRELCKGTSTGRRNMRGCVLLLQLWAWEHFVVGRPYLTGDFGQGLQGDVENLHERNTIGFFWKGVTDRRDKNPKGHMGTHRDQFDIMRPEEVNWTPYEDFRPLLAPICEEERTLALIPVPLICLHIVEMYHPDGVMRQFGLLQMIPPLNCVYDKELHEMKFEGGDDCLYDKELHDVRYGRGDDWPVVHEEYLQLWQDKWEFWTTLPASGPYDPSMLDAYLDWYARSTNHFVQTTIPHNSATYYPMVPATRRASLGMLEAVQYASEIFRGECNNPQEHAKKILIALRGSMREINDWSGHPFFNVGEEGEGGEEDVPRSQVT
ncbi:hypothetical protein LUZ60_016680 [Juncus effusus]|nr:hypothetical protein LUZ60_016680 [Juncus effusus]